MAAATSDPQWETRYRQFDSVLHETLKEAMRLTPGAEGSPSAVQIAASHTRLEAIENKVFDLVRQGQPAQAQQLLLSSDYTTQQAAYAAGSNALQGLLSRLAGEAWAERKVQVVQGALVATISVPLLMLTWWFVLRAARQWQTPAAIDARQAAPTADGLRRLPAHAA